MPAPARRQPCAGLIDCAAYCQELLDDFGGLLFRQRGGHVTLLLPGVRCVVVTRVAEDGSLWIGAHSNTLKLIQHFTQGTPAPSQVRRVQLEGLRAQDDIYLNDGREISASSVGVRYDNLLLIGSITARKLLVCSLN